MIHHRGYANLRMFLRKTKTSQGALARRLGIDPSYVSHVVAGRRTPGFRLAAKIAREANIPIESLLERVS
jgi:transcriptional regulator with XRE-family HTH domain